MRIGRYVKFLNYNGKIYAYNALNGGLCELEQEVYENILKKDFNAIKSSDLSAFNELKRAFYIVPDDFDETSYVKIMTWEMKLNKESLGLTIVPTLDCNFRCFYCYQQNYRQPRYMSKEIADNVVNFVKKRIAPYTTNVGITWYGGEPLLALSTIEYISKELKKVFYNEETEDEKKTKFKATIATNGYLLDERNSEILSKECDVKDVQVTLDGPREIHDRRRPHKDGPSYDVIIRNLKNNAHFFERVLVRINVDKTNKTFIPDLLKELKDMPSNVKPYLASVHTDNVPNAGFAKLCYDSKDFGLEVESKPEFIGLSMYPKPTYGVCSAVRENSFAIDPDGYLYKCWNEVGQQDKSIGSVVDGITNYERYVKWITFDPTDYQKCKDCEILPICGAGGCPYRVLFPDETGVSSECIPEKWILEKELVQAIEKSKKT
jgi:uncharacterized protein